MSDIKKFPLTVLIVDDEPEILEHLEIMLRRRVETVYTACNGREGLEYFKNQKLDLIISDLNMPIMDGIEFLKLVRESDEHIPFLVATGLKNQDSLVEAIEYEISSFLIKPIIQKKLISKIEKIARQIEIEKKAERSYALMEQYKTVVDTSSIVSKADPNGIITYVNDMFCKISGYSREELIGQPHNIVRDPKMPSVLYKEMWETIRSKKVWTGTIHNRSKNGNRYTVKTTITAILDHDGSITEYIGLREDITELELAKNEAKESARIKGEFLANMSHEIRTPMNGILGFTSLLDGCDLNEKATQYVNIINASSKTLLGIINDILDFSKLESGQFVLDYAPIKPFIEFGKIVQLFSAQMEKKKIVFKADMDSLIGECISIDLLRLQQVISNLLGNAIKFTPHQGEITLYARLKKQGDKRAHIRIGVKDSGIGIPQAMQEHIFQPFTQADGSITRKFGGTGLGLSISSQLVFIMGGKLQVQSDEGEGSDFYFDLVVNLNTFKSEQAIIRSAEAPFGLVGKVLVAEDNVVNQLLIQERLREYQLEPVIVNNGNEALDALEQQPFDLVFMDIHMPVMNGIDALYIIRAKKIKTPVVALTANAMADDRDRFLKEGFDHYLSKPILVGELQKILVEHLKKEDTLISANITDTKDVILERMLDMNRIQKEFTLSEAVIHKLLKTFSSSLDSLLFEIKAAIAARDFIQIEAVAHNLKGSSANLWLHRIVNLTQVMEKHARLKEETDYEEMYGCLEKMISIVQREIKEEIRG